MMAALTCAAESNEFEKRIRFIRQGALAYGDNWYDSKHRLVRRTDDQVDGRLNIGQHSPEYAGALLDTNRRGRDDTVRAHAIINAILDHQWLRDKGTRWYGNFFWWHDRKRPTESNAVAFIAPWLSYYLIEHADKLTGRTVKRLKKALPLCIMAVRKHSGTVHYDNIWFLKAASLVMISRVLDRPALAAEAEKRLDEWIAYVSRNGINEFNSPCYSAVNVYALEFIMEYAPRSAESLCSKTRQLLDFLYADIFQNWHWEGGIGGGTHSRAYPADRLNGESLASFLVYKQCGGTLRGIRRAFEYNFAVNSYRVPERIRAYVRKEGKTPLLLRASHPCWAYKNERVDRSLYMVPGFSLGTQTGYRANNDQAISFKITYAGSKAEERASFIRPVPACDSAFDAKSRKRGSITFAHHQAGPRAIVLYEADLKGRKQSGYMRLVIEPREGEDSDGGTTPGGMLDEILVNGKPYERGRIAPGPGTVIAWRVHKTCVAIRLLDCLGVAPDEPSKIVPRGYSLLPTKKVGVCLHGLVCYRPKKKVGVNNLSCGFVIRVATVDEVGSLKKFSRAAAGWAINETHESGTRDITWNENKTCLRLRWIGEKNTAAIRSTNNRKLDAFPLYESPLIHLKRGGKVSIRAEKQSVRKE